MRKLDHLIRADRDVMPVMTQYYDLFLYDRFGMLPCTSKGFNKIKTSEAAPIKKNP
jgi:hypothetical protein